MYDRDIKRLQYERYVPARYARPSQSFLHPFKLDEEILTEIVKAPERHECDPLNLRIIMVHDNLYLHFALCLYCQNLGHFHG